MKDKIIQITDTINNDGEGQTLGLSESGKLYLYVEEGHSQRVDTGNPRDGIRIKNVWIVDKKYWKLLIESPKLK